MSSVDEIIKERLRKLKSDEQAASGASINSHSSKEILNPPSKSDVEQVEDLLKQLSDETALDNAYGKDKGEIDAQIRRRLERLKVWELGPPRANFKEIGRLKSVPDVVAEVMSMRNLQADERNIEEDDDNYSGKLSAEEDETSSDDSNSPPNYCVFCKGVPSIVCLNCYNDSYCMKCFNEFHEPEDEHKTYMYVQKKKK